MMLLFSLSPEAAFSQALASSLELPLQPREVRDFDDGEQKLRPLVDPRGADVYVIDSLFGDARHSAQDKLCRLLMFIATLKDHGAARVTAVVPYLAYARKDRQTKPFDPVNLRYVAQLFEAVGTGQMMVLEVHNIAAFQNAFRCPCLHIEAHPLFNKLVDRWAGEAPLAVVSPDPGGVKRAQLWREALEMRLQRPVGFALADKRRSAGIVSSDHLLAGDVRDRNVMLIDDLIASGETMKRAAKAALDAGARQVMACAAHGLFTGDAGELLNDACIAGILVTDSVAPFRLPATAALRDKLYFASAAPLFALAIQISHRAWQR